MAGKRTHRPEVQDESDVFERAMEGVVPLKPRRVAPSHQPAAARPSPTPARTLEAGPGEAVPREAVPREAVPREAVPPTMSPEAVAPPVPAPEAAAAMRIAVLEAQVERLVADLVRAHQDLEEAEARGALAAMPGGGVPLLPILEERGLSGLDEGAGALALLLEQHALDAVLPWVTISNARRIERILADRLALVCSNPACLLPGGPVVEVPSDRCEVCGGESVPRALRRLSDACLLAGITRVLWVGGRARVLGRLMEGVDHRLALKVQPGSLPVAPPDDGWARVVVVWDDGHLSPLAARAGSTRPTARVTCTGHALAAACLDAAARIDALDPSALDTP